MAGRKKRFFHGKEKVKKDPLDLRDIFYEPALSELPRELDNWKKVPGILDQQQEGACVGFATAAVVNYLLHNRSDRPRGGAHRVSARMLYEMAKRYDEWKGEDGDGSSIRGAMKGWYKHGVAKEALWPYEPDERGAFSPEAAADARERPLGAYYRVRHLRLSHMHAALNEVGILLASSAVHEGWDEPDAEGRIPYVPEAEGGHAFAIIGYDETGFWIQNSWGEDHGWNGFYHLSYDDWLEKSWDCWVARMGVPLATQARGATRIRGRAQLGYLPHAEREADIQPHLVQIGYGGALDPHGRYGNTAEDVACLVEGLEARMKGWKKKRVALYAHGGLVSANAAASSVASMRGRFLDNEIYPIHFIWQTDLAASAAGAARNVLVDRRAGRAEGRFEALWNEAVELAARPLGKPLWSEMKRKARLASADEGGARILVQHLAQLHEVMGPLEIHLVSHSAGAVFHCHLLERLAAVGLPVESIVSMAPAATADLFDATMYEHRERVDRSALFCLTDRWENDDKVGPYRRSLLYLVSESFERQRHEELLGVPSTWKSTKLQKHYGKPRVHGPTQIYTTNMPPSLSGKLASNATRHTDFDNDDATLNSMLRVILRRGTGKLAGTF